jgi:hypothetical protein
VRLADPGGDLLAGHAPEGAPQDWPLTAAVARAVTGESGTGKDGYRNYLGRPAVGAWRWYPKAGIGLLAEQESEERAAAAAAPRIRRAAGCSSCALVTAGFSSATRRACRARGALG